MTEPGGDATPAATTGEVDAKAQEVVTDLYNPDGNRQDRSAVEAQPERQNVSIVEAPGLSPEVASAAAAEIEAAELGDAATASRQYEGGDSAPDPQ